ncbi:MAG: oligosaccharide flippase family protein [Candidatus Microgenomates bacterium]
MGSYYDKFRSWVYSGTVKDTTILFIGNSLSAFWGFLFTLIVARSFSLADFGVFSAALNLVNIFTSLSDIGISSGSVNFVAEHLAKGDKQKADEYIKASFLIRLLVVFALSVLVILFAPFVASRLLATRNPVIAIWVAVLPIFWFPDMFFPNILQAKRKFLHSTIYDNSFYIARLLFVFIFYLAGMLTMSYAFWAFATGFAVNVIFTFIYVRIDFIRSAPSKDEYRNLLKFSGWIGVNRIISSISGRLDITMLAAMVGAVATGLYSIPSRLATFILVLGGSYSSVLATRLAGFGDRAKEKVYIIKSTLATIPFALGVVLWIILAGPFIHFLFPMRYWTSVPIFQALAAAQIPFLFTVPPVSAIIYSMKKTVFIGVYSFFQIAAIFFLNFVLIPKYGPYGPTITYAVTNIILAIYTWYIVIKHYWFEKVD